MKTMLSVLFATAVLTSFAVPTVSDVTISRNTDGSIAIGYKLSDAPAVITLDLLKDGVSIGEDFIQPLEGDVNRKIAEDGTHTIIWRPTLGWPGKVESLKASVSAWAMDDTPDYMVVDLRSGLAKTEAARVRYYTSTNALPGGLFANLDYRSCKLVFRKIEAKDVTWTMGITGNTGAMTPHEVTLSNNYYMSIFPVTQSQYTKVAGTSNATGAGAAWFTWEHTMRVAEKLTYLQARHATSAGSKSCYYPNPPASNSFFGMLRTLVGDSSGSVFDFDFPAESQWEFACRGGHPDGFWGDGSSIEISSSQDPHLAGLGRYCYNGGKYYNGSSYVNPYAPVGGVVKIPWGVTNATPVVGSYRPNSYGLYDMNGSGWEWCLDVYKADITELNGAVYTPESWDKNFVVRGGDFQEGASNCRPGYRTYNDCVNIAGIHAIRVVTRAGLK